MGNVGKTASGIAEIRHTRDGRREKKISDSKSVTFL
jgi:hypothetical protein